MAYPGGPPPGGYGGPPPGAYGAPPPGGYGGPPQGGYGAPPPGPFGGPPPGGYGAPPGPYGAPPAPYGAPGFGAPGFGSGYPPPPSAGGFNLDPFASMGGYGAPPPGAYPPPGGYGGYPPPPQQPGFAPYGSQYGPPPVGYPNPGAPSPGMPGPGMPGMGMPGVGVPGGVAPGMMGQPASQVYNIQLRGTKLDRKDLMSKSDPFLIIYAKQGGKMVPVHKTEMIKNNQNPIWKPFQLSLATLGGADGRFKIECQDWDPNGNHDLIGTCETSINELRVLRELKLQNKNKTLHSAAGLLSVITLEPAPPGTVISTTATPGRPY